MTALSASFNKIEYQMKKLFAVLFAFSILVFNSCADNTLEPDSNSLEANFAKWKSLGINDYTIVQSQLCFCIYGGVRAVIQVRNNQIVSVQDSAGVREIKQEYWQYYKTVDQLFATLSKAVNDKPSSITFTFDKSYGYPKDFFVDPNQQTADEEYGYSISSFKQIK